MKKVILLGIIIFFFSNINAQEKVAKKLVNIWFNEKTMSRTIDNMVAIFAKIEDDYFKESDRHDDYMKFVAEKTKAVILEMADKDLAAVYEEKFTEEEMQDLVTFFSTHVGKKFIDISPEISKEVQDIMLQKYYPQLMKEFTGYLEKQKK